LIHTGDIVTKVVGTSFNIKSPIVATDKTVEVEVVSGKVSVFRESMSDLNQNSTKKQNESLSSQQVLLTPNQKVTCSINSVAAENISPYKKFVAGIVAQPIIVEEAKKMPKTIDFKFDESPLSEVVRRLEIAYGIKITLSNPEMGSCPLRANLNKESLWGKLDIICLIMNAQYNVVDTHVELNGRGCE
jgi:transmembrane sensor